MRTELISIATNTLPLDGAFYVPEAEPCGAVMLFHGNTITFMLGRRAFCHQCWAPACHEWNLRRDPLSELSRLADQLAGLGPRVSLRDGRAARGAARSALLRAEMPVEAAMR
jgi:hypothetical protein